MYSAFAPGTRLPANGAALWDNVLVPLALTNTTLQATLPLLGLNAAQFAAIVGSPQAGDLSSTMMQFDQTDPSTPMTTWEVGYTGVIADAIRFDISGYNNRYKNFIGPLKTLTPSVFIDGTSVANYLVTRLTGAGVPATVATQLAGAIAPTAAPGYDFTGSTV